MYVCMYVCMYVRMYVCMYVYVCVCVCVFEYKFFPPSLHLPQALRMKNNFICFKSGIPPMLSLPI